LPMQSLFSGTAGVFQNRGTMDKKAGVISNTCDTLRGAGGIKITLV